MPRIATGLGFLILASLVFVSAQADEPRPQHGEPDLASTQVTLAINNGGRTRLFQATALGIDGDVLIVLTAASRVDGKIEGKPAQLLVDGVIFEGTVVSAARNPSHVPGRLKPLPGVATDLAPIRVAAGPNTYYNNTRLRSIAQPMHTVNRQQLAATTASEIPGSDNAIVRLRFAARPGRDPNEPALQPFRKIRPATALTSSLYPVPSGATAKISTVGGDGQVHGVMACNFHNPLLLEWGHGFDPTIDDTGAGVFVLRQTSDGKIEPILIGVVIGPDSRGGYASLVAHKMPWVAEALAEKTAPLADR